MVKEPVMASTDLANLDCCDEDCVIGGPDAFVVPIKGCDEFKKAIGAKFELEVVVGLVPEASFSADHGERPENIPHDR
jgi:hypothetical protein